MTIPESQDKSRALSSSHQRLKKLQLALGSWGKVAAALEISQQMIFAVMNGRRQLSDKVLARLSKVEHEQNVLTLVDAAHALADERGEHETRSILRDVLAPAEQEYQQRIMWQQKAEALERKIETMRRRLRELLVDTDETKPAEASSKSTDAAGKKILQTLGARVRTEASRREAKRRPGPSTPEVVSAKPEVPAQTSNEPPSTPKRGRV